MKIFLLFIFFLFLTSVSNGQSKIIDRRSGAQIQTGISAKATIEFQRSVPSFRMGITSGLGFPVAYRTLYPALNVEMQVYYRGLGTTSGSPLKRRNLTADLIGSGSITTGFNYQINKLGALDLENRNRPLYYFTEFVEPAIQNPFRYSLSVGKVFVVATDRNKAKLQRIGAVNVHLGAFQLNYYNDGGGFQYLLGDGEDRYFTGGGFAAVTLSKKYAINQLIISYHKFSGFSKYTFDVASDVDLAYVNYPDPDEAYYNKSFWSFSASNIKSGWTGFFRVNNPYNRVDFQNTIHYVTTDSYHQIPYPRYYSIGGSFSAFTTQFGSK